jgi:ankyrin repeat protein
MLKQFIEAGANIEATNSMGLTLLGIAAYRGQDDCVQLLVDAGAKLETRGSKQNQPK